MVGRLINVSHPSYPTLPPQTGMISMIALHLISVCDAAMQWPRRGVLVAAEWVSRPRTSNLRDCRASHGIFITKMILPINLNLYCQTLDCFLIDRSSGSIDKSRVDNTRKVLNVTLEMKGWKFPTLKRTSMSSGERPITWPKVNLTSRAKPNGSEVRQKAVPSGTTAGRGTSHVTSPSRFDVINLRGRLNLSGPLVENPTPQWT